MSISQGVTLLTGGVSEIGCEINVVVDTEGPQVPSLSDLGLRSFEEEHSNDQYIKSMKRRQYILSSDRLQDGEPFILDIIPHLR